MSFIGRFFLLVLVLGFGELYLLVKIAGQLGFFFTLGVCILTGVIGGALVRHQGLQTLMEIQNASSQGQIPAKEIISGLVLLIVGAMLITPGFITDTIGFLLLVPPIRYGAAGYIATHFQHKLNIVSTIPIPPVPPAQEHKEIIDVEVED